MKPTRGSEGKANPNRKMDQAQLQALSGSGNKANPNQHPKGVDQAQRAKRICPQPSRSPKGSDSEANPSPTLKEQSEFEQTPKGR